MHVESEGRSVSSKAIWKVVRDYLTQYRATPGLTAGAFIFPAVGTILAAFVPPLIVSRLINLVSAGAPRVTEVSGLIFLLGGLWFLGELCWRVGMHFLIRIEARGKHALGRQAFQNLLDREYAFYTDHFVGSLSKKALAYASRFETFSDLLVFNIFTNVLPILFALIVLWRYSVWLPLALATAIGLVLAVALPIIHRRSHLVSKRHASGSLVSAGLSDALTNMVTVKSYANEGYESKRYASLLDTYIHFFTKAADYGNLRLELALSPLYVIANVAGLFLSVYLTLHLGLPVGTMMIVFAYYVLVTRVFWELNHIYRTIESSIGEAAEFTEILLDPVAIQDREHAPPLEIRSGSISFTQVNFRYGDADTKLFLENFNLTVNSGERVGLVGPSGGGKTTITKLLLRFVDVESGEILIDGQNIREVTQESLRRAVGYVPQDPLLFHRSLYENISYGNPAASREEVIRAATLAHAHDFIESLPHGYDTLVGERGVKLSGGQRQRVAIARTMLKNAPLLVLDEATSALDSESEHFIQEGLWELMKDKTALVIAHRLSTIKHLDRIIVLHGGRIVEDGSHDELVKHGGVYAKLWSHQSGGFIED